VSQASIVANDFAKNLKPAYRAAALAYRSMRQRGYLDLDAFLAARDAVVHVRPDFTVKEASRVATAAISYASTHHRVVLARGRFASELTIELMQGRRLFFGSLLDLLRQWSDWEKNQRHKDHANDGDRPGEGERHSAQCFIAVR
jgi:hypothetical protein